MNRKEYVDWAVKVLTVVRSVWSTFSGEGASEWRESVHKEFIKTGITPKDYLDFVCSILHISRKVKIILLDGTVQEAKILDFLDMSYDLTDGRIEESIESGHPVCYCWCSRNVWWRCSRMENYRIYLLYYISDGEFVSVGIAVGVVVHDVYKALVFVKDFIVWF